MSRRRVPLDIEPEVQHLRVARSLVPVRAVLAILLGLGTPFMLAFAMRRFLLAAW